MPCVRGNPSDCLTQQQARLQTPGRLRRWTSALEWHGRDGFNRAPKEDWRVDDELAGFIQRHERFANVEILDAGHMVRHCHMVCRLPVCDPLADAAAAFSLSAAPGIVSMLHYPGSRFGMAGCSSPECTASFKNAAVSAGADGSGEANAVTVCRLRARTAL